MTDRIAGQRDLGADIVRIFAYCLVCFEHLLPADLTEHVGSLGQLYTAINIEPAMPLFFLISGAYTIGRTGNIRRFFLKKFYHVVIPLIVFSFLYALHTSYFHGVNLNFLLTHIPFQPIGEGSFWFLYTLVGLYIITPILSRWVAAASRNEMRGYLFLWFLTSLLPHYAHFVGMEEVRQSSWLYYISGWIGYYLLGYYLRRYRSYMQKKVIVIAASALLAGESLPAVHYLFGLPAIGLWCYDIGNLLTSVAIYIFIMRLCEGKKSPAIIATISFLTFGCYLLNEISTIYVTSLNLGTHLPPYLHMLVNFLIIAPADMLIVWVISKIPILRKAVGA